MTNIYDLTVEINIHEINIRKRSFVTQHFVYIISDILVKFDFKKSEEVNKPS